MHIQAPLFFLPLVVFGSFFLLNLILAAIMDSFEKTDIEKEINKQLIFLVQDAQSRKEDFFYDTDSKDDDLLFSDKNQ